MAAVGHVLRCLPRLDWLSYSPNLNKVLLPSFIKRKKTDEYLAASDTSRSDAEKIQSWCRLVRTVVTEKFLMLLVSVLFMENIDVSDGFWGLTKNSAFKLWYESNVKSYEPVDAPKPPKRKSDEAEDDWNQ